jgi:hypothetical protein
MSGLSIAKSGPGRGEARRVYAGVRIPTKTRRTHQPDDPSGGGFIAQQRNAVLVGGTDGKTALVRQIELQNERRNAKRARKAAITASPKKIAMQN